MATQLFVVGICLSVGNLLPMITGESFTDPYSTSHHYHKFGPSMLVVSAVLSSALVFLGVMSFFLRRCCSRRNDDLSLNVPSRRHRFRSGLAPNVIDSLPSFLYSTVKGHKLGKSGVECAVCLCEFGDEERLRLIPNCSHVFHSECIDKWFELHTTCPVCRFNLESLPEIPPMSETINVNGFPGQNHVSIAVDEDPSSPDNNDNLQIEMAKVDQNPNDRRPIRSISTIPSQLPRKPYLFMRSNSTGHSLISSTENHDRFSLRLPDDVLKKIVNDHFNNSNKYVELPPEKEANSNNAIADSWIFKLMTPNFRGSFSFRSRKSIDEERLGVATTAASVSVQAETAEKV